MTDKAFLRKVVPSAFVLGIVFDLLFWRHGGGVNFPIFTAAILLGGYLLANEASAKDTAAENTGQHFTHKHGWLLAGIIFFALAGLWRREAFSLLISYASTLGLLAIFAASFGRALWPQYGLLDYIEKIGLMPFRGLMRFGQMRRDAGQDEGREGRGAGWGAILRGLLLAIPLVLILGALLSAADSYFAEWVERNLAILKIENLDELIGRMIAILIVAYGLIGVYVYALRISRDEKVLGDGKALIAPFLGFKESAIVLGSVILLFAIFVGIQVRYFFGGAANVNVEAFSYAEYARQGFGELVLVAVISVALFVALSIVGQRNGATEKKWFSGMGVALFLLVGIILISAYQRLLLYESAYGFTRTRTNVHVFMIGLGLLLVALVVLEIAGKRRYFTLALVISIVAFGASINLLNVDRFIVAANAQRLRLNGEIDIAYLASISTDAAPQLITEIGESTEADGQQLIAALACHAARQDDYLGVRDWQSFNFSRRNARVAWAEFLESGQAERISPVAGNESYVEQVGVDGDVFDCWDYGYYD